MSGPPSTTTKSFPSPWYFQKCTGRILPGTPARREGAQGARRGPAAPGAPHSPSPSRASGAEPGDGPPVDRRGPLQLRDLHVLPRPVGDPDVARPEDAGLRSHVEELGEL